VQKQKNLKKKMKQKIFILLNYVNNYFLKQLENLTKKKLYVIDFKRLTSKKKEKTTR
jgi:hypothetical protein